jgi:nicotinamide phosphoribosyltransferase
LLQQVDRDTQQWAFKCSSITRNGVQQDVFKRPASDPAKNSKRGRLGLFHSSVLGWQTIQLDPNLIYSNDQLEVVYENGAILREENFADIRTRAAIVPVTSSEETPFSVLTEKQVR